MKIDFPPNAYHHVLKHGVELAAVENLLITHTHQDHFYFEELYTRSKPFARLLDGAVLHGNSTVHSRIEGLNSLTNGRLKNVEVHVVESFKEFNVEGYLVTPLIADHSAEQCLIYVVSDGEKTILHGYDSGWFPEETWRHLNFKLDLAILDCTNDALPEIRCHMGLDSMLRVKEEMVKREIAGGETMFVATHLSHNSGLLYGEPVDSFDQIMLKLLTMGLFAEL